jgi:hypothetical protein
MAEGTDKTEDQSPVKDAIEQRLTALEAAFHASLSHLGAQHPTVVQWLQSIRDRISAALGGAKPAATPPASKEE